MSDDVTINNEDPGLIYEEKIDLLIVHYAEDREVDGAMYRVQNAQFDKTDQSWSLYNDLLPAFAVVKNRDGSISHFTKAAGSGSWSSNQWDGNGQRGVYDVKDFGALGDGTTNDTTKIQAAADAASSHGGGVVYCPFGRYAISQAILLDSNTTLLGDGPSVSVLVALAGMNGYEGTGPLNIAMVASSQYADAGSHEPDTTWQENIFVRNLGLYGNAADNVGSGDSGTPIQNGLITLIGVNNQGVYGCSLQSSANDGILIGAGTDGEPSTPAATANFHIEDCTLDLLSDFNPGSVTNVDGCPIHCEAVGQGDLTGNIIGFGNLIVDGAPTRTGDGLSFPGCSGISVSGNQISNCQNGINAPSVVDVVISSNIVVNCSARGITSSLDEGSDELSRLIIASNVIDFPDSVGIVVAGSGAGEAAPGIIVSDNSITLGSDLNITAISLEAEITNCHHNAIDLGNSASTAITCTADNVLVDSNYVFNAGDGSIGISIVTPRSGLQIINNNVLATTTKLSLGAGAITDLASSVIRQNDGINPYGAIAAPPITGIPPVVNTFPFDCMVYIHGGGTVSVSLDGTLTGLGSGLGYLVPIDGSIKVAHSSLPTWIWIAN